MDNTKKLNTISFFAGYGGVERGLEMAGERINHLAICEIETYVIANLISKMEKGEMGSCPIWTDAKTFPGEEFRGHVDLFTGGFPCQSFSSAGSRRADEDPRHLFPFCVRAIDQFRPKRVFFENVEGLISAELGGDGWSDPKGTSVLIHVLRELERRGYEATWGVFSASETGAPHQRKRVFILGQLADSKHDGHHAPKEPRSLRPKSGKGRLHESEGVGTPRGDISVQELADSRYSESQGRDDNSQGQQPEGGRVSLSEPTPCDRTSGQSSQRGTKLGNSDNEGLERPLPSGETCVQGRDKSDRSFTGSSGVFRGQWPSRPGQPQHEWEEPRTLFKSELGRATNVSARRVDRLRLLGNGVVPTTAAMAWALLNGNLAKRSFTKSEEKRILKEIYCI